MSKTKPLATVKLKKDWGTFYLPSGKRLCESGVLKVFDLPVEAKRLWLSVFARPAKNRVELRLQRPCQECADHGEGDSCPGLWLVDGENRELETPRELTALAKKHNRTVFYLECEWE